MAKSRHCEPTGRREAPPDDRLREAVHAATKKVRVDCFAALAMTPEHDSAFSPLVSREFYNNMPPYKQRAWGMPGARRTRSLVCAWDSEYAHEYSQRVRRDHPASPRNGLRLIACSPWRSGFLVTIAGGANPTNLTPASRRQDHTSLPSASVPFVIGPSASTASRLTSVTIAKRPSDEAGRR